MKKVNAVLAVSIKPKDKPEMSIYASAISSELVVHPYWMIADWAAHRAETEDGKFWPTLSEPVQHCRNLVSNIEFKIEQIKRCIQKMEAANGPSGNVENERYELPEFVKLRGGREVQVSEGVKSRMARLVAEKNKNQPMRAR